MPYCIVIHKKTVILSNDTKSILTAYFDILRQKGLVEEGEKDGDSILVPKEEHTRKTWWAGFIVRPIESLLNTYLRAKEQTLDRLEVYMDPPAKRLFEDYQAFLSSLIQAQKNKNDYMKSVVKEKIYSPYVLVIEILYRLSAVALHEKMSGKHNDGDNLLSILSTFLKKLSSDDHLRKIINPTKKLSKFSQTLEIDHQDWLSDLTTMVQAIKLLHANKTTITNILNHLTDVKKTIMRQLLAFLKPDSKLFHFDTRALNSSLARLEMKFLTSKKKQENALQIFPHDNLEVIAVEKQVVEKSSDNISQKLQQRYLLLSETNRLINVFEKIDTLFAACGWVPIFMGILNIDNLSNLVRDHGIKCKTVLGLATQDSLMNKTVAKHLQKYQAINGSRFQGEADKHAEQLTQLQKPKTINSLINYIRGTLKSLMESQQLIGVSIVNEQRLQIAGKLFFGPDRQIKQSKKQDLALINEEGQSTLTLERRINSPMKQLISGISRSKSFSLSVIDIANEDLTKITKNEWQKLRSVKTIQTLKLVKCQFSTDIVAELANVIRSNKKIRVIDFSGCYLGTWIKPLLKAVRSSAKDSKTKVNTSSLRELVLTENGIDSETLKENHWFKIWLKKHPKVRLLDLAKNRLQDLTLDDINAFISKSKPVVNFSYNGIYFTESDLEQGVTKWQQLLRKVTSIDISKNIFNISFNKILLKLDVTENITKLMIDKSSLKSIPELKHIHCLAAEPVETKARKLSNILNTQELTANKEFLVKGKSDQMLDMLTGTIVEKGAGDTICHVLVANERFDVLNLILSQYINQFPANIRNLNGDTLLHMSLSLYRRRENANPETVARLINFITLLVQKIGENVNSMNKDGNTPLVFAISLKNTEIIKLLLENGADKTIKNHQGRDALYFANQTDVPAITELLTSSKDNQDTQLLNYTK